MKNLRLLSFLLLFSSFSSAQTITGFSGFYRNGQVFLTWKNVNSEAYYKVYRSNSKIIRSDQLSSCEYLGYTNKYSAEDHSLSAHDGVIRYLHIDSGGIALPKGGGLFVATSLVNGDYYYAITTILDGIENKTILGGTNSLNSPISELVAEPLPVFQEQRFVAGKPIDIYATFFSTKRATEQPLQNGAGCVSFDFAVNRNISGTGQRPLLVLFHGGGGDFLWNIQSVQSNEIIIGLDDELPSGENNGWFGDNEHYDIFKDNFSNTIPVSGVNYNYQQENTTQVINWAIRHLPVDSNRIYLMGTSMGAGGAFTYTINFPEKIAAVKLSVPCFNYGFQNDYNPLCSLNPGNKNRNDGDVEFGKVSTNLMSNLGIHFYDAVNGGWMIHAYREKDYPVIFASNGKNDVMVGWTEKPIYYDSVRTNHTGGYYFWDEREHGGDNATWTDASFNLFRYRKNCSFPAFANCSNDEDYGKGDNITGAAFGTVNGSLDWDDKGIKDSTHEWEAKLFVRDLLTNTGQKVAYPDSCTADITPRRLQQFHVPIGKMINWTVTHKSKIIQSGMQQFMGGIIVIPKVKVFKDSVIIRITYNSDLIFFYMDQDQDGYGNREKFIEAADPPPGYVADSTDCNDLSAVIHPGAIEICNGVDDNCNGETDEGVIIPTVTTNDALIFCEPGSATLNVLPAGSGYTYQWYKNNEMITPATSAMYEASVTGTYSCKVSSSSCFGISNNITVTSNPAPAAEITPSGEIKACPHTVVTLTASAGDNFSYQWLKKNKVIAGASSQSYSTDMKGLFSVVITNQFACRDTSVVVQIKNYKITDAGIKILYDGNLNLCSGPVKLKAMPSAAILFKWFRNNIPIAGASSMNLNVTAPGDYQVEVSDEHGCSSKSEEVTVFSSCRTGVELNAANDLFIYPNPNKGDFAIDFSTDKEWCDEGILEIINALGQVVFTSKAKMEYGKLHMQIHLDGRIASGLYFVRLQEHDSVYTERILVEK